MAAEASVVHSANPRGLVLELFRGGARAAAPEPGALDLLDQDGTPVIAREAVLSRVSWYVGVAPVVLRLFVLPAGTVVLIGMYGLAPLVSLTAVVAGLSAADGLVLVRAARRKGLEPGLLRVGFALAVGANLLVAATVRATLFSLSTAVTGGYLATTVILWTLAWGGLAGLSLMAANVPLQAGMVELNHAHDPGGVPHALAYAVAGTIGLGLAVGAALIALTVLGSGTRLAMTVGVRAGREAERAIILRGIHDTVLQTLEAIALHPVGAGGDAEQALEQVRGMARSQAIQIRQVLDKLGGERASRPQLSDDLAELAGEVAAAGLRVHLALGPISDAELTPARRAALRDATREALRNAVKHAGVAEAVLRLDECDGEVVVVVRDHGLGFDPSERGFGLQQSVCERMADVGGRAEIWSQPGWGTRVTLYVPLVERG